MEQLKGELDLNGFVTKLDEFYPPVGPWAGSTTLLYRAVWFSSDDLAKMLLDSGVDPNRGNEHGWTPLMAAARMADTIMVPILLGKGANPNAKAEGGETALALAEQIQANDPEPYVKRKREVAQMLRDAGAR